MKRLVVLCSALLAVVLAACASSPTQESAQGGERPVVLVYRPPT